MSVPRQSRGLFVRIWNNFVASLSVRPNAKGDLVGRDPYGNEYWEIAANPRSAIVLHNGIE
jgi:hypothetical protein